MGKFALALGVVQTNLGAGPVFAKRRRR